MSDPATDAMVRALSASIAPRAAKRAAGPSARAVSRKELPVTEDRVLDLPSDEESARQLAEIAAGAAGRAADAVATVAAASAPQQAVLAGVPEVSGGYTKTRLGTVVLVGNVGASKNIVYKRVAGKDLVEFSFAAKAFGADAPTWYRATLWQGAEADLDLVRQGMYLQLKGAAVQSQSHKTGKIFLDVTVARLAEGPVKGQQLSVAGSVGRPQGYFRRLWNALFGR